MMEAAAVAAPRVSRAADRALAPLLTVLLVALMTSITLVGVVTGVIIVAGLVRLADPSLRARDRTPLAWPLLAFAVVTLVSALHAEHPGIALFESKQLLGIALFLAAVNGFHGGDGIRRALRWLYAAVAVVSFLAFLQVWACGTSAPLPEWVAWMLRIKLEACRASPLFRAKAFFSIYMTLGGSLLIVLSLMLATFAGGARAWRRPQLVTGGLAALALALTYVRSAWLGLGVAVLVLAGLTRRWAVLLVLLAAALLAVAVPSPLKTRVLSITDRADPSATERIYFWAAGVRMVADAPLLGLGPAIPPRADRGPGTCTTTSSRSPPSVGSSASGPGSRSGSRSVSRHGGSTSPCPPLASTTERSWPAAWPPSLASSWPVSSSTTSATRK